jgi:hypothetical protein
VSDAGVFDFVCTQLESRTGLDRLAVRGTVRIALKQAGLDASGVTPEQMAVVLERVLPEELTRRGIAGAAGICAALATRAREVTPGERRDTADAVFRRLGEA